MSSNPLVLQQEEERTSNEGRRSSSLELDVFPPRQDAKGKGKVRELDGQETVEEDADDSDAEVEGLLHKGKVNIEDGTIETEPTDSRKAKLLGGGRSSSAKTVLGRMFGDMSAAHQKLFAREMMTEVSCHLMGSLLDLKS